MTSNLINRLTDYMTAGELHNEPELNQCQPPHQQQTPDLLTELNMDL